MGKVIYVDFRNISGPGPAIQTLRNTAPAMDGLAWEQGCPRSNDAAELLPLYAIAERVINGAGLMTEGDQPAPCRADGGVPGCD